MSHALLLMMTEPYIVKASPSLVNVNGRLRFLFYRQHGQKVKENFLSRVRMMKCRLVRKLLMMMGTESIHPLKKPPKMFDWLNQHHDSPELEHAKQRQEERDAQAQQDPLEDLEYLDEENIVVKEISVDEYRRLLEKRTKKSSR